MLRDRQTGVCSDHFEAIVEESHRPRNCVSFTIFASDVDVGGAGTIVLSTFGSLARHGYDMSVHFQQWVTIDLAALLV